MTEKTNVIFRAMKDFSPLKKGAVAAYRAWENSRNRQSDSFEIDHLPWPQEMPEFVAALRLAEVSEIAITDKSTGLMEGLHALEAEGCKLAGLCKVTRKPKWEDEDEVLPGILVKL